MKNKYTIKKNTSNIRIDSNVWKKLSDSKIKRNWEMFLLDEKKLNKWL